MYSCQKSTSFLCYSEKTWGKHWETLGPGTSAIFLIYFPCLELETPLPSCVKTPSGPGDKDNGPPEAQGIIYKDQELWSLACLSTQTWNWESLPGNYWLWEVGKMCHFLRQKALRWRSSESGGWGVELGIFLFWDGTTKWRLGTRIWNSGRTWAHRHRC